MVKEQPEALRLADALEGNAKATWTREEAAAELRRLHLLNQELLEALKDLLDAVPPLWGCAERAKDLVDKIEGVNND